MLLHFSLYSVAEVNIVFLIQKFDIKDHNSIEGKGQEIYSIAVNEF